MTGNRQIEKIIDALNVSDPVFKKAGNNKWNFSLNHGCLLNGTVRNEDSWILFDAYLPPGSLKEFELVDILTNLLISNRQLPGNVKWVITREGILRLRAEIPVRRKIEDDKIFQEIIQGLQFGWEQYRQGFTPDPESLSSSNEEPVTDDVREYLRQACADKHWQVSERAGGETYVNLEVSGVFQQASFLKFGGQIHIYTTFGKWEYGGDLSLKALSSLLLSVGGFVRQVRPSAFKNEECGSYIPIFEVALYESPPAAEISGALSALSVACNLCAREMPLMRNKAVAGEYLAVRHSQSR